jgi:DNA polymerase III delta subunit
MAVETALSVLRAGERLKLPAAVVISGPHAFLREYVFDRVRHRLVGQGKGYRGFQVGGADGFDAVLAELREPDLFAPARLIACRVLRSHRGGSSEGEDDSASGGGRKGAAGGEAALAAALEAARPPSALVVIYDRDSAPARIRRAVEHDGLAINCMRPFDNQLVQFAEAFASAADLRLGSGVAELLVSRHAGDLSAIANTLAKAAIHCAPGATLGIEDLSEPAAAKVPELFDLAEAIANGSAAAAFMILERALAVGRDPLELLSVEIIPTMRRMMLAASMAARRHSAGQIAGALGLSPAGSLAQRTIAGARRFGFERLSGVYRRASELDAGFKNGRFKERDEEIAALLIDLFAAQEQR